MVSTKAITTAEQLLEAGDHGRCELRRGQLVMMSPSGSEHGRVVSRITVRVGAFVEAHRLGATYGAETGFIIERNPDSVRAPDLSFVSSARLPTRPRGFFEGAPDLAVEVVSPDDRPPALADKAQSWRRAGTQVVWVLDPQVRLVTVYDARGIATLSETDRLTGEPLLPGFSVSVADIFAQ